MTIFTNPPRRLIRFARREPAVPTIYFLLILTALTYFVLDPSVLSPNRATVILAQKLPLVLVAVGQTIVFLTRGLDLSVGGIVALSNVVIATNMGQGTSGILIGVALGLLVGIVAGATNGVLVGLVRLPPIIVTLATWSILDGIALYVLPQPGGSVPAVFGDLFLRRFGPIPLPLILMIVIPMLFWWPVRRSRLGHAIYATGNDEIAAYSSGISVLKTKIVAYTMSGFFSALGAILLTTQALSGDPRIGDPFTLNSIAAVVLGGTLLAGGRGGVLGTVAGALVLATLSDLLFFAGISTYWQYVVSGGVLILALALGALTQYIAEKRG